MFRAQANPFDEAVVKATDENLTQENWQLILDVCDRVEGSDSGGKDAVAAMIKRLAHRNANVQLYTLELANSLSQNCGLKMHKELASRSFTDAMLRLANDRNTHQQVKAAILERMADWTNMFSGDPDLGIMEQAFSKLKAQNPSLQPPSKPTKSEITETDRQKEEEELQMALALSIKDKDKDKVKAPQAAAGRSNQAPAPLSPSTSQSQNAPPPQPVPSGTTAATVSRVRALYNFQPSEPGELQFRQGDVIAVLESVYKDWWRGSLRGQSGIFPLNYVEKLQDPTPEELQREAQMEAEVFGEIKNVEKLLALLSTSNSDANARDNEEITALYHSTLAIRPKLIELMNKYSQKKDDFTQLNEKFIKARRDYEVLLEASMSQPPPQQGYSRPPPQGAYSYGAPPAQTYPPQQDPQRFYASSAQDQHYPPRDGPQPFYMIPQSQQQQPPYDNQVQATKPLSPPPQPQLHQQPAHPPPTGPYAGNPQELAANPNVEAGGGLPYGQPPPRNYSPASQSQQFQNPHYEGNHPPQDSRYSQYQYGQYGQPPSQQQQQPPPLQPQHAPPQALQSFYPAQQGLPPVLQPGSPPPQESANQYQSLGANDAQAIPHMYSSQPYQPATTPQSGYQQQPRYAAAGGATREADDVSDFYR